MRFEEQTALVTGGTRGIGHAIAARLADEGAAVFLTGTDASRAEAAAEELDAGRGRVRGLALDLTDPESVRRSVAAASANGGLQILVNNAGVPATVCSRASRRTPGARSWRPIWTACTLAARPPSGL